MSEQQYQASNPGDLTVNKLRYWRYYPKWPTIWFLAVAGSFLLAWYLHWSFWILTGIALALLVFYWWLIARHYRIACVTPAQVLSTSPMLIAVATDLTKGEGQFPCVKILPAPVGRVFGTVPRVGTRLAVLTSYECDPGDELPHFVDIDPKLAQAASGKEQELRRLFDSLSEEDWQQLEAGLKQLGPNPKPGLHRLWEEESGE